HKGGTNTDSMVLLCYRHHWLVHEGSWQIARTEEGVITVPPLGGLASFGTPRNGTPERVFLNDWAAARHEYQTACEAQQQDEELAAQAEQQTNPSGSWAHAP
ncbi:MAG: hypothetical protein ACREN2_04135, partial [Candidatus Dormibacteria bacterium]